MSVLGGVPSRCALRARVPAPGLLVRVLCSVLLAIGAAEGHSLRPLPTSLLAHVTKRQGGGLDVSQSAPFSTFKGVTSIVVVAVPLTVNSVPIDSPPWSSRLGVVTQ